MTSSSMFFLIAAVIIVALVFNLLRSRKLREKYAALWVIVGLMIIILALFPGLLNWLARLVGVQVPANLLFALAIFLLLGVCLQLSLEISRVEDKTRVLAEHIAILNLEARISGAENLPNQEQAQQRLSAGEATAQSVPEEQK